MGASQKFPVRFSTMKLRLENFNTYSVKAQQGAN